MVKANGASGVVDELRHLWRRCDSGTVLAQPPAAPGAVALRPPWRCRRRAPRHPTNARDVLQNGGKNPDHSNLEGGDVKSVRDDGLDGAETTWFGAGLPAATVRALAMISMTPPPCAIGIIRA